MNDCWTISIKNKSQQLALCRVIIFINFPLRVGRASSFWRLVPRRREGCCCFCWFNSTWHFQKLARLTLSRSANSKVTYTFLLFVSRKCSQQLLLYKRIDTLFFFRVDSFLGLSVRAPARGLNDFISKFELTAFAARHRRDFYIPNFHACKQTQAPNNLCAIAKKNIHKHTLVWFVNGVSEHFFYIYSACVRRVSEIFKWKFLIRRTQLFFSLGTALLILLAVIQTRENYRARVMLPSTAPNQPGECAPGARERERRFSRSRPSPRVVFVHSSRRFIAAREGYIITATPLWVASLPHGGLCYYGYRKPSKALLAR